jgi:hypothetical protein
VSLASARGLGPAVHSTHDGSATRTGAEALLTLRQVRELQPLLMRVESVELKVTVPEDGRRSALQALALDPLDARIRQVFFLDTPDLALGAHGVVVRARRTQRRVGDSTVKRRPLDPSTVPAELRHAPGFSTELDVLPGGYVCSGSLRQELTNERVAGVHRGRTPVHGLFDDTQRDFYATSVPGGPELDDLVVLGPVNVLKLKLRLPELDRRLVAEQWMFPDGSRTLELSARCEPEEAFAVAADLKACLAGRGIDLTGDQETKTHRAMTVLLASVAG